ncbi:MAG: archaetidylserine decarboxylase, partial [Gammaproteobacteria bacterium]|nr:archaetidylserine decarboxylase [Gammaproteobacteria bacterium]
GTVSAIGTLTGDRVLQAKGRDYSLAELLAGNRAWTERFANGQFATIYLAPYNYHRIHMPCDGELREAWFVPGRLFSVNRVAIGRIANVFTRNERVICLFDGTHGPFGLVLVGALNVGSIETVWHGGIAPRRGRCAQRLPSAPLRAPALLHKGAELGRFNLGSTVIVLFPPRRCRWRAGLQPGSALRMGAAIGDLDMQS